MTNTELYTEEEVMQELDNYDKKMQKQYENSDFRKKRERRKKKIKI